MKQSKQVYFSHGKSARFGANWPSQSLKKGPKLKIPLRLQFQMTVSVNDFKPHKWLLWSIEFNETVTTSLLLSWQERPFWSKLALSEPQNGPKLKIPLRLQFQFIVFVNDFIPHKWLLWSLEFNETVKTSLLLSWHERPFWC